MFNQYLVTINVLNSVKHKTSKVGYVKQILVPMRIFQMLAMNIHDWNDYWSHTLTLHC